MNGRILVSIIPSPDGLPRTGYPRSAMFRKSDLAVIDRVLAGRPAHPAPRARSSRRTTDPDGPAPAGWSRRAV